MRDVGIGKEPEMVPELGLKQWPLSPLRRPRAMRGQWLKIRRGTCLQKSSDHWFRDTTSPRAQGGSQGNICLASLLCPGASQRKSQMEKMCRARHEGRVRRLHAS